MTTLKQQLKTGDTKIYVNDLSKWNANSGHYYNWAAIFSYTDETGYTYPDGQYTQNCARFGSSTSAKTNLDKTNNIITLNSAYTGPTMPVGTKICASTEGSTYYYPIGNINLATIQDWTYKEGTFSGNHNRIKYAKTVTFFTYSNNRMAGIKIQDLTNEGLDTNIEYDTSGFCNNGTKTGTFTWTCDTPKYNVSQYLNNPTGTSTLSDKIYISASPNLYSPSAITVSFWFKKEAITRGGLFTTGPATTGTTILAIHDYDSGVKVISSDNITLSMGSYDTFIPSTNIWYYYVITFDGINAKIYINGDLKTTKSYSGTKTLQNIIDITLGANSAGGVYRSVKGYYSDFRIYATALSAEDVKSLYNNSAYIDNQGNIYGAVYEEV